MKIPAYILSPFLWIALLLAGACTPIEDCQLDPNSTQVYISFNHDTASTFSFDSVKNDLVNTIYYDADTSFSLIPVPLAAASNDIRYEFFTDSTDYFMEIQYRTQANVYGEDCDASLHYFNIEVMTHNFDSVAINNDFLDRRIPDNIEVYF